jgi:hypothetical protein
MLSDDLRMALSDHEGAVASDDTLAHAETAARLAGVVRDLLAEPTNVQALALAKLMRDYPNRQVVIHQEVFDLPSGYWLAILGTDGFQCGIAPDGSVSS